MGYLQYGETRVPEGGTVPADTSPPGRSRFTRSQILILIAGCCSSLFVNMAEASVPLILPLTVVLKGIPYAFVGLIFSMFSVSIIVFEPLQAKLIPFLGTRTTFCISSFVGAACYFSFAVLNIAEKVAAFVATATILRFVEGFVYATLSTSSNVIVCLAFPEHATIAFGILECFVGIGYTIGPILSGALYEAGGFSAACVFIGLSLLVTGLLGYFVLVQITGINLRPKPRETKRVLLDRIFLGVAFVNFSGGLFWGILGTSLEPHLASFGRGAQVEGLIFAVAFLAYAGTAPIFGWILLKFHVDYRWAILAPLGVAIACMFLGPLPSFTFIPPRELWLITLLLFIMNVFIAFGSVLVFDTLKERTTACGLEENVATYALIIAVFFTTIYIGDGIGAITGSAVYFESGFVRIAEIATGLLFACTIVAALILLLDWSRLRDPAHRAFPSWIKSSSERAVQDHESSPLTKLSEFATDESDRLPSYDEAAPLQSTHGVNQATSDYGSIRQLA